MLQLIQPLDQGIPAAPSLAAARLAETIGSIPCRPRACDLLQLAVCRHHLAHQTPLVIPLNMSLGWEKAGSPEYLPTLVPSGIFWLVGRGRPLLGVEAVRLQGCDPSMLPGLRPESHDSAFLMDLAGNAFCVYQFCAWFCRLGRGRPYVVDARDGCGSKSRGSGEGRPGPDEAAGPQGSGSGPGARLAIGMASIQWRPNCFCREQ